MGHVVVCQGDRMPDHSVALVPLGSWVFNSPDQVLPERQIDIGLLAEALIYYDRVLVDFGSQPQFGQLLGWFRDQNALADLWALLEDGTLTPYHYAFSTVPIFREGQWSLWNLQGEDQIEPNAFERLFLGHRAISEALPKSRDRARLYRACRDRAIEIKASQVTGVVENARRDIMDPRRCAVIVQQYVDVLYAMRGMGRPPEVRADVQGIPTDATVKTTWNIGFGGLSTLGGPGLELTESMPLSAGAVCNRLLWSARDQSCDLFAGAPMASLIGDKLYETVRTSGRSGEILSELKMGVDFPDVRAAVNRGDLTLSDVLRIRKKALSFRLWLQDAADRDQNALVAYHHEVAKETGFTGGLRMTLRVFGWLVGGAVGNRLGETQGAVLGAFAGEGIANATTEGVQFLFDQIAGVNAGWRPVVFGDWTRDYIERVMGPETTARSDSD
jgi:hypothetical protein